MTAIGWAFTVRCHAEPSAAHPEVTEEGPADGRSKEHLMSETTTITIYGASDDLVEVDGCEGADEFSADRWQGDLAPPGEVEQMRVHCWYDADGCWQVGVGQVIEDHPLPPWPVTITQAPAMNPGNPGYSALLTIEAPSGTRLVNVRPAPGDGH